MANLPGAHPRSRGENPYTASPEQDPKGSSPLTRGKLRAALDSEPHSGLIPAHAGKTPGAARRWTEPTAHPRSRGENISSGKSALPTNGSSPLTRGKRREPVSRLLARWLIPAHAGKTKAAARCERPPPAHPRSRGENGCSRLLTPHLIGSSPLTRGKPRMRDRATPDRGLIPAHAGKTWRDGRTSAPAWAHPRSRGENACRWAARRRRGGSSPLTRGKPVASGRLQMSVRLIPAHAGKTVMWISCAPKSRAHPRSRGENRRRIKSPQS